GIFVHPGLSQGGKRSRIARSTRVEMRAGESVAVAVSHFPSFVPKATPTAPLAIAERAVRAQSFSTGLKRVAKMTPKEMAPTARTITAAKIHGATSLTQNPTQSLRSLSFFSSSSSTAAYSIFVAFIPCVDRYV